jgi:hypothetical protein
MNTEKPLPDALFAPITGHLPDYTLGPEPAIEFWVDTFAAVIDVQTLAALPAKARFVLSADRQCFAVHMVLALHFLITSLELQTAYPGDYPIQQKQP